MNLSVNNFNKPSNKKWKLIADIALYSLALFNPVIISAGFDDNLTKWLLFGVNTLVIVFKTISKFTSDEVSE